MGFRSSAVSLRRINHFWSSMTRRSCWLPERHVSENDELDNQKLSHTHLYPVSQIMMGSVASFASRTPLILGIKNPYLGLDIPRNGVPTLGLWTYLSIRRWGRTHSSLISFRARLKELSNEIRLERVLAHLPSVCVNVWLSGDQEGKA